MKKILAALLVFCVLVSALPGAMLVSAWGYSAFDIRVNGVNITDDVYSGTGWYFSKSNYTLTLSNYNGGSIQLGNYYADFTIILDGKNVVNGGVLMSMAGGSLTIKSKTSKDVDSLTIYAGGNHGIHVSGTGTCHYEDLKIENANIKITDTNYGYGSIYANRDLTITDSIIDVNASGGCGILAKNRLKITNSDVSAYAKNNYALSGENYEQEAPYKSDYGIEIMNSHVKAETGYTYQYHKVVNGKIKATFSSYVKRTSKDDYFARDNRTDINLGYGKFYFEIKQTVYRHIEYIEYGDNWRDLQGWYGYVEGERPLTLPTGVSKKGHKFLGWYDNAEYNGDPITKIPEGATTDFTFYGKWEPLKYTIKFDTDGSTDIESITQDYGTPITKPADPEKEGYVFNGWSPKIPDTMPAENMTIRAKWTPIKYKLTIDTDGGTEIYPNPQEIDCGAYPFLYITDPTKEGHYFIGWDPDIRTMPAHDVTVKAKWGKYNYKVTFWSDGDWLDKKYVPYGDPIVKPKEPTRRGYTFDGWEPEVPEHMPAYDMDFVAKWISNSRTITFDTDGGTAIDPIIGDYGTAVTKPQNPTKTGYTFVGWDNEIPDTIPDYNLTIKAIWKVNQYTITFDTNGGNDIAPVTQDYGTAVVKPENPTKKGYTFSGWEPELPDTVPAENITVTAKWTINQNTISFDTDGGTMIEPISGDYGTAVTKPANPTKTGYTFVGWDKEIPDTIPENSIVITAVWKVNQYTVTFNTDGGSDIAPITQDYNTAIVKPQNPTKTGYTFSGWDPEIPDTIPAENITVTAKWTINKNTIVFDTDGGTVIAPITGDYGTAVTKPENPTKTGYTFVGWDTEIPDTIPENSVTIKAIWRINQYTITFNTDGGTEIAPITQDYNTAVTKPANPTKSGYIFNGWDIEVPSVMPAENITVTAKWTTKAVVSVNTDAQTYTYDGSEKEFVLKDILPDTTTGFAVSYKQNNAVVEHPTTAGTYDVVITRAENDTEAEYNTVIPAGLVISKVKIAEPIVTGEYIYSGTEQTASFDGTDLMNAVSGTSAKDAGDYTAVFEVADSTNYEWADGSDGKVEWAIKSKGINLAATDKTSYKGRALAELEFTGDSLFEGDSFTGVLSTNADISVIADNYTITIGTLSAGKNYSITFAPGVYKVLRDDTILDEVVAQYDALGEVTESNVTNENKSYIVALEKAANSIADRYLDVDQKEKKDEILDYCAKLLKVLNKNDDKSSSSVRRGSTGGSSYTVGSKVNKSNFDKFADVNENDWYAAAVSYVIDNNIMNGVTENTFEPNSSLTRAMFVTMLYRANGQPDAPDAKFTDIPSGAYYAKAVGWAAANGIVLGVSDTSYAPNSNITREQMAAVMYRFASYKSKAGTARRADLSTYADAAQISDYARDSVSWACANELLGGKSANSLSPRDMATRAEAATILMRLISSN